MDLRNCEPRTIKWMKLHPKLKCNTIQKIGDLKASLLCHVSSLSETYPKTLMLKSHFDGLDGIEMNKSKNPCTTDEASKNDTTPE